MFETKIKPDYSEAIAKFVEVHRQINLAKVKVLLKANATCMDLLSSKPVNLANITMLNAVNVLAN